MQKQKSKEKGITLVALVVTIIVLIILAGVSIAMLVGENGIITQAQRAAQETEQAKRDEEAGLSSLETAIQEALGNVYNEEKGVNAPKLKEGMELVVYDEDTRSWKTDNAGESYSYIAGEGIEDNRNSRWANARVTIDGIESYFVWIPRYAYKITYKNKEDITQGGTIDVKFLKGTSNVATDGTVCKYANDETLDREVDYIIHPAFTSNVKLGGWRNELTGIWIGKYETARVDSTKEMEGTSKKIKVQPGVQSFRNETIGNMYTYAKEYAENLNSHMLKNSEWGAVAYLTHSQYGRNGTEIATNNSSECITGMSGGTPNATSSDSMYEYNNMEKGILASSTGNVYGIYDLSGGAWEYVAAYYENGTDLSKGNSFVENTEEHLVTKYSNLGIVGDATEETNGWNGDIAYFINMDFPFFRRGGRYDDNDFPGVFYFNRETGAEYNMASFRICIVI